MQTEYITERLRLRILNREAADKVLDYYERNAVFHKEWVPARDKDFFSLQNVQLSLETDYHNIQDDRMLRLWIFKRCDEDCKQVIGTIGFSNIIRGSFLSCFLGYMMDYEEINQGYVTEAIQSGVGIMFGQYGLHRIEANIMPKNVRSLRVVEKLGFQYEGESKKYLYIDGKWEDHIHMVLRNSVLE